MLFGLASCIKRELDFSGTYYLYGNGGFDKSKYIIINESKWFDQDDNGGEFVIDSEDNSTSIPVCLYMNDEVIHKGNARCTSTEFSGVFSFYDNIKTYYYCSVDADLSKLVLPNTISTKEEFLRIYRNGTSSYGTYDLIEDIDLEGTLLFSDDTKKYRNRIYLDGGNHTISNFKVYSSGYAGLFQDLEKSTIKNLNISNATIYGERSGGLAGNANESEFENINIKDDVIIGNGSHSFVGGIVGFASNSIVSNCINEATVKGQLSTGGILGKAYNSTIKECKNYGNVTLYAESTCGGIVGYFHQYWESYSSHTDVFSNNENYGKVDGRSGERIGGVIGSIYREKPSIRFYDDSSKLNISSCKNYGTVDGSDNVGGIVGFESSASGIETGVEFSYCSNYGTVKGSNNVGGIIGKGEQDIMFNSCSNEYNEEKDNSVSGCFGVGGIAGFGNHFVNCKNNGLVELNNSNETANDNNSLSCVGGITGKTYSSNKINFVDCENNGIVRGYEFSSIGGFLYAGQEVGGIVGISFGGMFTNCKNNGEIHGRDYVGGLIGKVIPEYVSSITDCEVNGKLYCAVNGTAGGFIGSLNYTNVDSNSHSNHYNGKFLLSHCKLNLESKVGISSRFGYCVGSAYSNSTSEKQYGNALIQDCDIELIYKSMTAGTVTIDAVCNNSENGGTSVLKCELDETRIIITRINELS